MNNTISDNMIKQLIAIAKRSAVFDEHDMVDDFAGGNIDDAYNIGSEDGETSLARQILTDMNIPYEAY